MTELRQKALIIDMLKACDSLGLDSFLGMVEEVLAETALDCPDVENNEFIIAAKCLDQMRTIMAEEVSVVQEDAA